MFVKVSRWEIRKPTIDDGKTKPDVSKIPAPTRRRLNAFGKTAGGLVSEMIEEQPLIVFASRYGDTERSVSILEQISNAEDISPMHFSLSVHNAVSGLLSIAWKIYEMQSVISAGENSLVMGLTEAFALIDAFPDKQILFVYVDTPLPDLFTEFDQLDAALNVGAILMTHNDCSDVGVSLEVTQVTEFLSDKTNSLASIESVLNGVEEKTIIGTGSFGWEFKKHAA
ncbi:MAG: beta-ketoacyl synthase chain length factor [Pseudomonas marincola]